jgi:hypothetical protein
MIKPTLYNAIKSDLDANAVHAALDDYRGGTKILEPHGHV